MSDDYGYLLSIVNMSMRDECRHEQYQEFLSERLNSYICGEKSIMCEHLATLMFDVLDEPDGE